MTTKQEKAQKAYKEILKQLDKVKQSQKDFEEQLTETEKALDKLKD